MTAKPAPAARPQPRQTPLWRNDTALEIGGGALALLALGGAAFAVSRRRRHAEEEEWYGDEAIEQHEEPVAEAVAEEPVAHADTAWARHEPEVMAAPAASAFAWGNEQRSAEAADDGSDRRPGETWVERAYRGPSPANPSASLKHRLRRAAFFDKRERDVAAGKAEPVDTDAGLPDAATEEFETA
jgi:hypothetical protein